jgi:hypothetical protein
MIESFFAALSPVGKAMWSAVFFGIAIAIAGLLVLEQRAFAARGKAGSWRWLRLASLPILAVTALVVVLAARAVSGALALAVFYLALFTVAPMLWFGLHVLFGRWLSPRMSRGESTWVALTGLAILGLPPLVLGALQSPLYRLELGLDKARRDAMDEVPLAHRMSPVRRLSLGDAGDIHAQTLSAPPGVTVDRIDAQGGELWSDTATQMHAYFCRAGEDLHLAWPVGSTVPPLRLYWHGDDGVGRRSEFRTGDPAHALPAEEFTVAWRDDGVDLPVPVARSRVQFGWVTDGVEVFRPAETLQRDENLVDDCVMRGYRRDAWRTEGPVQRLRLILHPARAGAPLLYTASRDASD